MGTIWRRILSVSRIGRIDGRYRDPRWPDQGDVNGVGVPLQLPERHMLYAFHCAGPASQLPLQRIRREIGPRLVGMISDIRLALGAPPQSVLVEPQIHQP